MSTAIDDINRLLPVLETAYQAQQLVMAKINKRIANLRAQMQELDRPNSKGDDPLSPAVMAGADIRWQAWAQERKKLINQELAFASRDKEMARVSLGQALAKLEAARQMKDRLEWDQDRLAQRRSSY